MKKANYFILSSILFYACTQEENLKPLPQERVQYSKHEIDKIITTSLQQQNEFKWEFVTEELVASALAAGDSLLAIGYKPQDLSVDDFQLSSINIHTPSWQQAKAQILLKVTDVLNKYSRTPVKVSDIIVKEDDTLPVVVVKVANREVIEVLRKLNTTRYAEPLGYPFQEVALHAEQRVNSDLGCGNDPASFIPSNDYQLVSSTVKVPWNFYTMNIPQAWQYSTGRGVGVALIDTGLSPDQNKLGVNFNQGESSGRLLYKFGTFKSSIWPWVGPDGPNDKCGHGTQMAGALCAPRGIDGSTVGVAYNANLIGIRGTADVVIESSSEQNGVIEALKLAANRSDVKIISMSIGTPLWSSSVADAVRYAYGKGKLIFAAAGTSTSFTTWVGVIFPARMAETVAVTGVVEGSYTACNICHKGSEVDFTIVMQRADDGSRTSLTLAHQGDQPSRVGGSSVATATTAGIAAMVWSINPLMSREQVLERLKQSAELYPNRNSNFGWGTINALEAVNPM
jgi:serine protease